MREKLATGTRSTDLMKEKKADSKMLLFFFKILKISCKSWLLLTFLKSLKDFSNFLWKVKKQKQKNWNGQEWQKLEILLRPHGFLSLDIRSSNNRVYPVGILSDSRRCCNAISPKWNT